MTPIKQAARELREQAQSIFECSAIDGDWRGDDEARAEHDRLIALAEKIEAIGGRAPIPDRISAQLVRTDWTPKDALEFYANGYHFDVVAGRTRIIDTGAVASNALKSLSLEYLLLKGDAHTAEQATRIAELESQLNAAIMGQRELERAQGVLVGALEGLLRDVQNLMGESDGVVGFHQNGDIAPWSELDEGGQFERLLHMTAAVEALAQVQKPANGEYFGIPFDDGLVPADTAAHQPEGGE